MAPRTAPPFRADHVGSLLRPPALLRARAGRAAGTITADHLTQAEDDAIRDAVAMQEAVGLRSATALTLDQQRAKLDLVVQTAAELWGY